MMPFPRSLHAHADRPGAFSLRVESEHPAFQGHFPSDPVLPGVVQLDWAIRLGARTFGALGAFRSVEHLKFLATIGPGEPLTLRLSWDATLGQLCFEYSGPDGRKSQGIAVFAPNA